MLQRREKCLAPAGNPNPSHPARSTVAVPIELTHSQLVKYTRQYLDKPRYRMNDLSNFQLRLENVIFEVLTLVTLKITIFWDVALCSLVDAYPTFRWNVLPSSSGWTMEAVHSSTTSADIYQITVSRSTNLNRKKLC
jgi:hypothetical protein